MVTNSLWNRPISSAWFNPKVLKSPLTNVLFERICDTYYFFDCDNQCFKYLISTNPFLMKTAMKSWWMASWRWKMMPFDVVGWNSISMLKSSNRTSMGNNFKYENFLNCGNINRFSFTKKNDLKGRNKQKFFVNYKTFFAQDALFAQRTMAYKLAVFELFTKTSQRTWSAFASIKCIPFLICFFGK